MLYDSGSQGGYLGTKPICITGSYYSKNNQVKLIINGYYFNNEVDNQ
jgi:hypothetical protein